jgi:predicted metal-dependent enzyme (double-stranded beta helix superfamily)
LGPAAAWLAQAAPAWEDQPGVEVGDGAEPRQRAYRLLVSSLHLEAWLICWPPGGRLELHDHGGASGALQVVRGRVQEAFLPGGASRVGHRELAAGDGVAFDGDYVHDVVNPGPALTTTVHVYGAASRSMSFYRLHPSSRRPIPAGAPALAGRPSSAPD